MHNIIIKQYIKLQLRENKMNRMAGQCLIARADGRYKLINDINFVS